MTKLKSRKRLAKKKMSRNESQKGGLLPLAALFLALVAGGKAVAAGALSGATGHIVKTRLEAIEKRSKRGK